MPGLWPKKIPGGDVNQIGSIYTASFTSAGGQTASFTAVGGENCKAFFKYGPPWDFCGGFAAGFALFRGKA